MNTTKRHNITLFNEHGIIYLKDICLHKRDTENGQATWFVVFAVHMDNITTTVFLDMNLDSFNEHIIKVKMSKKFLAAGNAMEVCNVLKSKNL